MTVRAGSTVASVDARGRHQIKSDNNTFETAVPLSGARFQHTFEKPGVYNYIARFTADPVGQDMAGTVIVT